MLMVSDSLISIEVVFAMVDHQKVIQIKLPVGATVQDAIHKSGILKEFPEIDLTVNKVGVYAKACKLDTVLHDHDRVEIYRPLLADPKETLRQHRNRQIKTQEQQTEIL